MAKPNIFDFTTDPALGRDKPDGRRTKQRDHSWGNLGQVGVPQDLLEQVVLLRESGLWPELQTNNDVVRDALYRYCQERKDMMNSQRFSSLSEFTRRAEGAAKDRRWFKDSQNIVEMRRESLEAAKSAKRIMDIIRQCEQDLASLHPDIEVGMRELAIEYRRRVRLTVVED